VNLQCARIGLLAYVVGIMALGCTSVFALRLASGQTNHASTYDPLKAFVGTWTAKNPNETKPYLFLKVSESHGKLTATISHFKMGVVGNGKIFGDPGMPGESSLADLTVSSGDLEFVWAGDPPLHGGQAKFVLEGTEVACLLISVSEEESLKMMADNHARGFNPIIWMRRLGDTAPAPNSEAEASRSTAMAMLINTAEEQYRFTHGNYADYPTLVRSGQLEKTAGHEFTFFPEAYSHPKLMRLPDTSSACWFRPIEIHTNCRSGRKRKPTADVIYSAMKEDLSPKAESWAARQTNEPEMSPHYLPNYSPL
jgi:hypothetical protein